MGEVDTISANSTNYDVDTERNGLDSSTNDANKDDKASSEVNDEGNSVDTAHYDSDTDTETNIEPDSTDISEVTSEDQTKIGVKVIKVEVAGDKKFCCPRCGNHFLTETACISHGKFCKKIMAEHFCKPCKQQFKSDEEFEAHVSSKHNAKTDLKNGAIGGSLRLKLNFGCPKCNRRYSKESHVKLHTRHCKGNTLLKFCKVCNVTFSTEDNLHKHMRRKHGKNHEEIIPDCVKCGQSFKRKAEYTKHVNRGCKLNFEENSNLVISKSDDIKEEEVEDGNKSEIQIKHTVNGKANFCKECNYTFSTNRNLRKHIIRKHSGKVPEIPPDCEKCGQSFKRKAEYTKHVQRGCSFSFNEENGNGVYNSIDSLKGDLIVADCETCGCCFESQDERTEHVKVGCKKDDNKEEEVVEDCEKCGRPFKRQADRTKHMNGGCNFAFYDKENTNFCNVCEKCGRPFKRQADRTKHMNGGCNFAFYDKENTNFCNVCKVKFSSRSSLRRHVKSKHNKNKKDEEIPKCDKCGRMFKRKAERTKHMAGGCNFDFHENVVCEECGKIFLRKKDLERHKKIGCEEDAKRKKKKQRTCQTCDVIFTDRTGYRRHMENVHGEKEVFPCEVCEQTFTSEYAMERHMTHHAEIKRLICHICGSDFKHREGLNRHLKKHAGLRYFCDQCPKSFTTRDTLKLHKLWHEGSKPHVCDKCGESFRTRHKLTRHIEIHGGSTESLFVCEKCGETLQDSTKLKRHMELHGGIRRHECKICFKRFVLREYMKSHEKIHTAQEQKTFTCDLCPYKTFRLMSMKCHKKTHFMKRDFQCKICERTFSQKHSLETHSKLHEKMQGKSRAAFVTKPSLFCKHCPKGFTTKRGLVRHTQKHIKGILPILLPGGVAGKDGEQEEAVEDIENKHVSQVEDIAPENSENNEQNMSDKPKTKKRKVSVLSTGERVANDSALNNNDNGTLGETGSLIKSTISNFSDMNIAESIVVPAAERHGMQVENNEVFNTLRWTVPEGRVENVPQVVVEKRGPGLHGGELYHIMSDAERHVAPVTPLAPVRLIENHVFGRESAFGLYAPPSMVTNPESGAAAIGVPHSAGIPHSTGIPHWTSCRFSQSQDLSSKFGIVHGEFGLNTGSKVVDLTSKFGSAQGEFGLNVGSKGVDTHYKIGQTVNSGNSSTENATPVSNTPVSLVRHEEDHNAFDEDTDIENYDDDLPFGNTADDENKVSQKKDSGENSTDCDFMCDVQCNKCNAKFYSLKQLTLHLVKGCGHVTGKK